jgi:hypothetical protein
MEEESWVMAVTNPEVTQNIWLSHRISKTYAKLAHLFIDLTLSAHAIKPWQTSLTVFVPLPLPFPPKSLILCYCLQSS